MGQDERGVASSWLSRHRESKNGGKKNIYKIIIQTGCGFCLFLSLFLPLNLTDFREVITTEVCFLELRPRYRTG